MSIRGVVAARVISGARLEVWLVAEFAMRFAGRPLAIDAAVAEHAGKDERGRSSAIDGP
jgi:hypothetical protein